MADKTRVYTIRAILDNADIERKSQQTRQLLEQAFAPVRFQLPDFGQLGQVGQVGQLRSAFADIARLDITKPIDELQKEIVESEDEVKRLEAQLSNLHFKGGFGSQASDKFKANLADYFQQLEDNFGRAAANRAKATGQIRIGDVGKQFINDVASPEDFGRTQQAFRELQEKKKFTIAEQRQQLELEVQIEAERINSIQLQRSVAEKELQQLQQENANLTQAQLDSGGREFLDLAYQEYEATSRKLIEDELQAVRTLEDRKRRISELDERVNRSPAATPPTSERATALTVTKSSAENAEKLANALKEAAAAQKELAEATRLQSTVRNDTGLQFERERLQLARQNAVITEQLVQQERVAAEQRRQAAQVGAAAQIEASRQASQAARAEANERTQAARTATAEQSEIEKRSTAEFVEEQKRRTAEFRTQLREQEAARRQAAAAERRAQGGAGGATLGGAFRRIEQGANLLTGGIAAYATVQLARQINESVQELDRLRVEAGRSKVSLDILSGSSSNAAARIAAIQQAGNGTINTLTAIQIAVQSTALGLANSTGEFERLTTAARAVTLVSPIIKDINGALAEISLAGANQSFRRLDQLGLGVTEVKDKIAELQAADKSLSDQQAFSAAVMDTLNSKYGALLKTTEAQASGQERLTTAWADFKLALADTAPIKAYDAALAGLANALRGLSAEFTGDFTNFATLDGLEKQRKRAQESLAEINSQLNGQAGNNSIVGRRGVTQSSLEKDRERAEQLLAVNDLLIESLKGANNARASGNETTAQYGRELANIIGKISEHQVATDEDIVEVKRLNESIAVSNQLLSGNGIASQAYLAAQEQLGKAFIAQDEDSKLLIKSLVDIETQYNQGSISAEQYKTQINAIRQAFFQSRDAASEYVKELDEKRKVELLGDAQESLGQKILQDAAQIVESTGDYDKAARLVEQKREKLAELMSSFPADTKAEDVPLIIAKFAFQLDQVSGDAPVSGGGALVNSNIVAQLQEIEAEKNQARRELLSSAKEQLAQDAIGQFEELVKGGFDPAEAVAIIGDYRAKVSGEFNRIGSDVTGDALIFAVAEINQRLGEELEKIAQTASQTNIDPQFALDDINFALSQLDIAALDSVPGLQSAREELVNLFDEISRTGSVTKDQAERLNELTAIAFAVGDATGIYASEVAGLGNEFFDSHGEAGNLLTAIAALEASYVNGKTPIDEYGGKMLALIDRLVEVAKAAGVTGSALDGLLSLQSQLRSSDFAGTSGFQSGRESGTTQAENIRLATAEEARREEKRRAEEVARAWEKAGREAQQAAERAETAFESKLQSVPGLFGASGVTQEQLDLAAAGVPQNFADDFVRRLEDLIKNGVQRPGVTIDRAKEALANVGVDSANLTAEQILLLIKQKFADSSLFANEANLDLINFDAVKSNLALQEQAQQGKDNIINYLKDVFDVTVGDLTGGGQGGVGGGKDGLAPGTLPKDIQADAKAALSLQIDDKAIIKLANESAEQFVMVFSNYDFSPLAIAPISAMEAAFANGEIVARVGRMGVTIADALQTGFTGRTGEVAWIDTVVNAIEAQVTNNVLSVLAN